MIRVGLGNTRTEARNVLQAVDPVVLSRIGRRHRNSGRSARGAALPAQTIRQRGRTDHAGLDLQSAPGVSHLSKDAPNILIVLIDDVGPAQTDTYGGEIHTPTLSKIANEGISYNRFHTTAMCSPTRAALLTGRNQHRVGNGRIGELANDWDGYTGIIPKSSATVAEVLKDYGYSTAAWGKWHNTPVDQTTAAGPFNDWPTGYGFEYFYGFLGGEASQYEPQLVRNTAYVEHPRTSGGHNYYHLSEDLADDAIHWLRQQKAFNPDKPFLMYWAPGASHGPHHVPKEWADKRAFQRARQMGWIPSDAQLTPRPATLASWDSIPEDEKPFQRRLMEVFAGFTEHVDVQIGHIVDEIDRLGYGENRLILYIWGDHQTADRSTQRTWRSRCARLA
jgi:arylsulfatase A-like enzyme